MSRDHEVLQKRPLSAASFPEDDGAGRILVQTRLRPDDAEWLADEANSAGLSVAGMLRRIVAEARAARRRDLDFAALDDRLSGRIRLIEERVGYLEGRP